MQRVYGISLLLLVGLASNSSVSQGVEPGDFPPSPESFISQGKAEDYLPLAKAFLDIHSRDTRAPQVAWDMYQTAMTCGKLKEARDARLHLMADHPTSLPAMYLMSQTSWKAQVHFVEICLHHSDLEADQEVLSRCEKLGECWGLHMFKKNPEAKSMILLAALASAGKRGEKTLDLFEKVEGGGPDVLVLRNILADPFSSPKQQFLALEKLQLFEKNYTAETCQWILYQTLLTDEERASQEIGVPMADHLLEDQTPALAARVLTLVCGKHDDPKLLYKWALAEAAAGKGERAALPLAEIIEKHPESPWAPPARELLPIVKGLDKQLAEQRQVFQRVAAALRDSPPGVIEMKLEGHHPALGDYLAYVGMDVEQEALEFAARIGQDVLCAFKASKTDNRSYLRKDGKVRQFANRMFLAPNAEVHLLDIWPRSTFGMSVASADHGKFKHFFDSQFNEAQFLSPYIREYVMELALANGIVPAPGKSENGEQILRWVYADGGSPELHFLEAHVSRDNRLVSLHNDLIGTLRVRYGRASEIALTPPKWPQAPVEKLAQSDVSEFFRLLGGAYEMIAKVVENEAEAVAERKKNPKQ
jgi:hypothetical protein